MKLQPSPLFLAFLTTLSMMSSSLAAGPFGGPGGSPFTADCGADRVVASVYVRAGTLVDSVQLLCVKVNALGEWLKADGVTETPRYGGSGGSTTQMSCKEAPVGDRGWGVVGIHGRAASLVDALGIRCGRLISNTATSVKATTETEQKGPAGGSGGTAFTATCPSGQVARGLKGRSAQLIDQIELICHFPTTAALQPITVALHVSPASNNPGPVTLTASVSGCCQDATSTKTFAFSAFGSPTPPSNTTVKTTGTSSSWKPQLQPGNYGFSVEVTVTRNSDNTRISAQGSKTVANHTVK